MKPQHASKGEIPLLPSMAAAFLMEWRRECGPAKQVVRQQATCGGSRAKEIVKVRNVHQFAAER